MLVGVVDGVQMMMGLLADAFWTMGRIWPSLCPRRMSYGPELPCYAPVPLEMLSWV